MSYRVILASDDDVVVTDIRAIASESGGFTLVQSAATAAELMSFLATPDLHVIILHEDLGPMPVLDLARDLANRMPHVGLVLLARDHTAELLSGAMRAGFRRVARLPLSLEDLQAAVLEVGGWAEAVQAQHEAGAESGGGRMVAIAGAKGGVGTTSIAVHLALAAATATPRRSVCLVDFDVQSGDVRSYLNLTHRRSVADLIEVAADLSARQLEESLSVHESGLRVLLPPSDGEQGEDVTDDVARRVLGGIRTRFDVVVVDVGSVVTEAGRAATAMADDVLLVTTPDVPALRGANRLLSLWERLQIRQDGIEVILNRTSRDGEVQPDLAAKIVDAPLQAIVVPADFRALEPAANTGVPGRVEDGPARKALAALAEELRLVTRRRRSRGLALRSSSGQVAAETVGITLLVGLITMLLWEIALVGYTFVLSGHAAREAARELAVTQLSDEALQERLTEIAVSDLPDSWNNDVDVEVGDERVEVTLAVPMLVPGNRSPWRISTGAGTVRERGGG